MTTPYAGHVRIVQVSHSHHLSWLRRVHQLLMSDISWRIGKTTSWSWPVGGVTFYTPKGNKLCRFLNGNAHWSRKTRNLPFWRKKAYLKCKKRSSQNQILNHHLPNWKILKFSKMDHCVFRTLFSWRLFLKEIDHWTERQKIFSDFHPFRHFSKTTSTHWVKRFV